MAEVPLTSTAEPHHGRPRAERTRAIIAPLEPLAVGAEEAATLCGVGKTLWAELDSAAKIPAPMKLGSRCVWCVAELRSWMLAGCPERERWEQIKKTA